MEQLKFLQFMAQWGIAGVVLAGAGLLLVYKERMHREERNAWTKNTGEERTRFENITETWHKQQMDVVNRNTEVLSELKTIIKSRV